MAQYVIQKEYKTGETFYVTSMNYDYFWSSNIEEAMVLDYHTAKEVALSNDLHEHIISGPDGREIMGFGAVYSTALTV